jgi:hypothetical protein
MFARFFRRRRARRDLWTYSAALRDRRAAGMLIAFFGR